MAYVYRHIRLDKNEPFYIGIGKNKYRHSAKQNRNQIWQKIVSKTDWKSEILFDNVTWEFACKKEIEFISLYGRINNNTGILANMTDGGDGNLGLVHSAEAIKKISESSKRRIGYWNGKRMSEETRAKMSSSKKGKSIKGHPVSERLRNLLSARNKGNTYRLGKNHTEASRIKMSKSCMGRIAFNRKEVFQYSLDGTFMQRFDSLDSATKTTGARDIHLVAKGKRKTSGGFIWRYSFEGDKISLTQ